MLGPEPYRVAYVQPSRRPADGRYGENPNRLYKHHQLQVILKPSPPDIQDLYLESLAPLALILPSTTSALRKTTGKRPRSALGESAGRCCWTAWRLPNSPTSSSAAASIWIRSPSELTYGLDRIAAYLQDVDNVFDVRWSGDRSYGEVRLREEQQFSAYSFDWADPVITRKLFDLHEREATQLLDTYDRLEDDAKGRFPILAAYDQCLKCSHLFNVLDSRGVISVTERAALIATSAADRLPDCRRRTSISEAEVHAEKQVLA